MDNKHTKQFIIIAITIFLITILYGILMPLIIKDSEIRGTFGDMFGALNALFAGLAFAGVIISMRQQQEELEHTRKEVRQQANSLLDTSIFELTKILNSYELNFSCFIILKTISNVKEVITVRPSFIEDGISTQISINDELLKETSQYFSYEKTKLENFMNLEVKFINPKTSKRCIYIFRFNLASKLKEIRGVKSITSIEITSQEAHEYDYGYSEMEHQLKIMKDKRDKRDNSEIINK